MDSPEKNMNIPANDYARAVGRVVALEIHREVEDATGLFVTNWKNTFGDFQDDLRVRLNGVHDKARHRFRSVFDDPDLVEVYKAELRNSLNELGYAEVSLHKGGSIVPAPPGKPRGMASPTRLAGTK